MHRLFEQAAHHHALGRLIEQVGHDGFWQQLVLLLNQLLAFDSALVSVVEGDNVPRLLHEFDRDFSTQASPMPAYLSGLYLLDPFMQALRDGIADGVYRIEEVAPDEFRRSEYFDSHFRPAVGEDELQLIVTLAPGQRLALSLGAGRRFDTASLGLLQLCAPWLSALIHQHWRQAQLPLASEAPAEQALQVEQALATFGSANLSNRELEIARLVLRGNSSKAIANRLAISLETVKVHRRNLYGKLGVSSQSELFSLFLKGLGQAPG